LPCLLGLGLFALFGTALVLRHDHADLLGQVFHGLDEGGRRVLHQEADGVAVHAAAEAVVGLAAGADDEARRLLAVEGAQALVVDAGLLQVDMAPHHVDDVDAGQQVMDEALGDHPPEFKDSPAARPGPGRPSRCG